MSDYRVIMITSCKGGVGKSTVAANLGIKLALNGHKTLVLDCDFGVRSLDLIMGLADEIIYDISDVILREVKPEKAIIHDERSENLFFCAAPYNYNDEIDSEVFCEKVRYIGESMSFEYIIIDTPGDVGNPFKLAAAASNQAIVVSTYQPASVRAAERTGMLLEELGITERRLIINCFDPDGIEFENQPNMLDIIDKTCIQLIGIIPYDARLAASQSRGEDVFTLNFSNSAAAFSNIADRIVGRNIPLFTGFRKINRKSLLKKIQRV